MALFSEEELIIIAVALDDEDRENEHKKRSVDDQCGFIPL